MKTKKTKLLMGFKNTFCNTFPQIKFRQSSSECTKVSFRRNYFLRRLKDLLCFLCLYGTTKGVNENENKENEIVVEF